MSTPFPTTNCWMTGAGPWCDVVDSYSVVDITDPSTGATYSEPGDGRGAADQKQCMHDTEMSCQAALNRCFYNTLGDYLTEWASTKVPLPFTLTPTVSMPSSPAVTFHAGDYDWLDFQYPLVGGAYQPPRGMRIVSSVNAKSSQYGRYIAVSPIAPHPLGANGESETGGSMTPFLPHAYAKSRCLAKALPTDCNFRRCYCDRKRCVRCDDDGEFKNGSSAIPVTKKTDDDASASRNRLTTDPLLITRSRAGDVIPLIYGLGRVGGNLVWAGTNKLFIEVFSIESGNGIVVTEREVRTIDFVISMTGNPIKGVRRVWIGDQLVYNGGFVADPAASLRSTATHEFDTAFTRLPPFDIEVHLGGPDGVPPKLNLNAGEIPVAYRDQSYIVVRNYAYAASADFVEVVVEVIENGSDVGEDETFTLATGVRNFSMARSGALAAVYTDSSIERFAYGARIALPVGSNPADVLLAEDDTLVFTTPSDPSVVHFILPDGQETTHSSNPSTPDQDWMHVPTQQNSAFLYTRNNASDVSTIAAVYSGPEIRFIEYGDQAITETLRVADVPNNILSICSSLSSTSDTLEDVVRVAFNSIGSNNLVIRSYILSSMSAGTTEPINPALIPYRDNAIAQTDLGGVVTAVQLFESSVFSSVYVFAHVGGNIRLIKMQRNTGEYTSVVVAAAPPTDFKAALTNSGRMRWTAGGLLYTLDLETLDLSSVTSPVVVNGRQAYDGRLDRLVYISGGSLKTYYPLRVVVRPAILRDVVEDIIVRAKSYPDVSALSADYTLTGFKITKETTASSVLESLSILGGFDIVEDGVVAAVSRSLASPVVLSTTDTIISEDWNKLVTRDGTLSAPRGAAVKFYDAGENEAVRDVRMSRAQMDGVTKITGPSLSFDTPAVMFNDEAAVIVERILAETITDGLKLHARVGPKRGNVSPGTIISFPVDGIPTMFRVTRIDAFNLQFEIEADAVNSDLYNSLSGHQPARIAVVDDNYLLDDGAASNVGVINTNYPIPLQAVGSDAVEQPCVMVYALPSPVSSGANYTSRTVTYKFSSDAGPKTAVISSATIDGTLLTPLASVRNAVHVDNSIEVSFATAPVQTAFVGDTSGINFYRNQTLIVGKEIIRYSAVTWSVDGLRATFSGLLRGDRNTWIVSDNPLGTKVFLFNSLAMPPLLAALPLTGRGAAQRLFMSVDGKLINRTITLLTGRSPPPMAYRDDDGYQIFGGNSTRLSTHQLFWNANQVLFSDNFLPNYSSPATAFPGPEVFTSNYVGTPDFTRSAQKTTVFVLAVPYDRGAFFNMLETYSASALATPTYIAPLTAAMYLIAKTSESNGDIPNASMPVGYKFLPGVGFRQMYWVAVTSGYQEGHPDFGKDGFVAYGRFDPNDNYTQTAHHGLERRYYPLEGSIPLVALGYDSYYTVT